jgi:hypothetical protein
MKRVWLLGVLSLAGCGSDPGDPNATAAWLGIAAVGLQMAMPQPRYQPVFTTTCNTWGRMTTCQGY